MKKGVGKKGLSQIVTTLLIILLSIVAIGILWVVIRNVVSGSTNNLSFDQFSLNLRIGSAYIDGSNVKVVVRRDAGAGNLTGVVFVFHNGTSSLSVKRMITINQLEEKTFTFTSEEVGGIDNVQLVSISPVYSNVGNEIVGSITDTAEIGSVPPIFGGGGTINPGTSAVCGDRVLNAGEECDSGTGCNSACRCAPSYDPTIPLSVNCVMTGQSICGNSICEADENSAICPEDCPIPSTCNGVWDGALEDSNAVCDGGTHCLGCSCLSGFYPTGLGGCAPYPAFNSGTVESGWPSGVVKYIDSENLPKDSQQILSFIGKYMNFTGQETRCLQISYAEYLSDAVYNRSYLRLELPSSVAPGDGYEAWNSTTCGV